MLGLLLYAIVCFTIAGALTWISVLFSKVGSTADKPAVTRLVFLWLAVFALPYGWVEFNTARRSKDFELGVENAVDKGLVTGELAYFKVRNAVGESAKVLVVTDVEDDWGGTYRNLYHLDFEKDSDGWHVRHVTPLNTKDGDSAGFSVPPYW